MVIVCLVHLAQITLGKQFWLDETTWRTAQQKTKINQDPIRYISILIPSSFDTTKYPSSNFAGTKLSSYSVIIMQVLTRFPQLRLTYKNSQLLATLYLHNNFDSDPSHTKSSNTNVIVRSGHAHQFDILGTRVLYNGWTKVVEPKFTVASCKLHSDTQMNCTVMR